MEVDRRLSFLKSAKRESIESVINCCLFGKPNTDQYVSCLDSNKQISEHQKNEFNQMKKDKIRKKSLKTEKKLINRSQELKKNQFTSQKMGQKKQKQFIFPPNIQKNQDKILTPLTLKKRYSNGPNINILPPPTLYLKTEAIQTTFSKQKLNFSHNKIIKQTVFKLLQKQIQQSTHQPTRQPTHQISKCSLQTIDFKLTVPTTTTSNSSSNYQSLIGNYGKSCKNLGVLLSKQESKVFQSHISANLANRCSEGINFMNPLIKNLNEMKKKDVISVADSSQNFSIVQQQKTFFNNNFDYLGQKRLIHSRSGTISLKNSLKLKMKTSSYKQVYEN